MFPTDIVIPRGTLVVERRKIPFSPLVNIHGPKGSNPFLQGLGEKAKMEIRSSAIASKGAGYPLLWFWKTIIYFTENLSDKPMELHKAREALAKSSAFSQTGYDRAIKVLFKI